MEHFVQSPHRKLAYTERFKDILELHPHLLSIFRDIEIEVQQGIRNDAIGPGHVIEQEGIKVTLINSEGGLIDNEDAFGDYFKVEVDGQAFFVKTVLGLAGEESSGVDEAQSLEVAKSMIADLEDVDIVDFQFGYQDKTGKSYFVSEWVEGAPLDMYLGDLKLKQYKFPYAEGVPDVNAEISSLEKRFKDIEKRLGKYFEDVKTRNVLYNSTSKKFYIYDIHKKKTLKRKWF